MATILVSEIVGEVPGYSIEDLRRGLKRKFGDKVSMDPMPGNGNSQYSVSLKADVDLFNKRSLEEIHDCIDKVYVAAGSIDCLR